MICRHVGWCALLLYGFERKVEKKIWAMFFECDSGGAAGLVTRTEAQLEQQLGPASWLLRICKTVYGSTMSEQSWPRKRYSESPSTIAMVPDGESTVCGKTASPRLYSNDPTAGTTPQPQRLGLLPNGKGPDVA